MQRSRQDIIDALRRIQVRRREQETAELRGVRDALQAALRTARGADAERLRRELRDADRAFEAASVPTAEAHARLAAVQELHASAAGQELQAAHDAAARTGDDGRYQRALRQYAEAQRGLSERMNDLVALSAAPRAWAPRKARAPRPPGSLASWYCGTDYARAHVALLDAAALRARVADAKYALADARTRLGVARRLETFLSATESLPKFASATGSLPKFVSAVDSFGPDLIDRAVQFAACAPTHGYAPPPPYLEPWCARVPEIALAAETVRNMIAFLPIPAVIVPEPTPLKDVFSAVAGVFSIWPAPGPGGAPAAIELLQENAATPTACVESAARNVEELKRLLTSFKMAYGALTTEAETSRVEVGAALAAARAALERAAGRIDTAMQLNDLYAARANAVMAVMQERRATTPAEQRAAVLERLRSLPGRSAVRDAFIGSFGQPGPAAGGGPLGGPLPAYPGLHYRVVQADQAATFRDHVLAVAAFLNRWLGSLHDRWCSLGPRAELPFPVQMSKQASWYTGTLELRLLLYESPAAIAKTREGEAAALRETLADLTEAVRDANEEYRRAAPAGLRWSDSLKDAVEAAELRVKQELQQRADAAAATAAALERLGKDAPLAHLALRIGEQNFGDLSRFLAQSHR